MSTTGGRRASRVPEIRDKIKDSILSGELPPDTPLSSVQLGKRYDVSRTPLREALRLLQEEGLVTMTDNHRARVALNSPDDLDAVYAQRILLSALCTALSVVEFGPDDVSAMQDALDRMVAAYHSGDIQTWRESNGVFHNIHMASAPPTLADEIVRLQQRCQYFYTLWATHHPNEQHLTIEDHRRILKSCEEGCPRSAAEGMAAHLHRVGATLFQTVSSESTPVAMNMALAQVSEAQ